MLKPPAIAPLFVSGLLLASCTSVPPSPQTWKFSGYELVQQKCGGCHATDMDHYSINPDAPPLRDLFRRYPIDGLDEAFAKGLEVGHYDMPRFTLAPEERTQILEYLHSLNPCAKSAADDAAMRRCFAPLPDGPAGPAR